MNANQRFAAFGIGVNATNGNGQYFSTINNYPGVPTASGMLTFNNHPQMQHHRQRQDRAFVIEDESELIRGLHGSNRGQDPNQIMHFVGGSHNERSLGPGLGYPILRTQAPCDICGVIYFNRSTLTTHRRIIHGC